MVVILAIKAGMVMRPGKGQPVYSLKVASGLVGLSPRTIRLYEEAELIAPARVGGNQQRLYSEQDLEWLRCIRDLIHEDSLTVAAIRRLLDLIPCWEIKHCAPEVAQACRPHVRIPDMAGVRTPEPIPTAEQEPDEGESDVRIRLFYGVQELGSVLPCTRCIAVERACRRIALKYPERVTVSKADILSEESQRYGVIMSPTIVVNDELLVSGTGISESRLEAFVKQRLEALDTERAQSPLPTPSGEDANRKEPNDGP